MPEPPRKKQFTLAYRTRTRPGLTVRTSPRNSPPPSDTPVFESTSPALPFSPPHAPNAEHTTTPTDTPATDKGQTYPATVPLDVTSSTPPPSFPNDDASDKAGYAELRKIWLQLNTEIGSTLLETQERLKAIVNKKFRLFEDDGSSAAKARWLHGGNSASHAGRGEDRKAARLTEGQIGWQKGWLAGKKAGWLEGWEARREDGMEGMFTQQELDAAENEVWRRNE